MGRQLSAALAHDVSLVLLIKQALLHDEHRRSTFAAVMTEQKKKDKKRFEIIRRR